MQKNKGRLLWKIKQNRKSNLYHKIKKVKRILLMIRWILNKKVIRIMNYISKNKDN